MQKDVYDVRHIDYCDRYIVRGNLRELSKDIVKKVINCEMSCLSDTIYNVYAINKNNIYVVGITDKNYNSETAFMMIRNVIFDYGKICIEGSMAIFQNQQLAKNLMQTKCTIEKLKIFMGGVSSAPEVNNIPEINNPMERMRCTINKSSGCDELCKSILKETISHRNELVSLPNDKNCESSNKETKSYKTNCLIQ